MNEKKLTDSLIGFALHTRFEDIPPGVIEMQKKSLLDSIGVICAATTLEPACKPFIEYAEENSVSKNCTIFGTDKKASSEMAATANGSLIHALDYEDGHDLSKAHPNTASTPVMLAFGQSLNRSGRDVLAAMVISSEICCRLKMSLLTNDLLDCGVYSPPMFSAYGAVFGASRLLGLDENKTLDALSICMTQIMLLGQSARSSQSVLRGIREGFSARAAAFSAIMAQKGVFARMDEPFEGKLGLFMSCFRAQYDPDIVLNRLGESWESGRLRFKPWPCCGTTHAVLDVLFSLIKENGLKREEIEGVDLIVNPVHLNVLDPHEVKYRPKSLAAAKFSLPFSIALGVRYGNVLLDMYKEEELLNPVLMEIMDKTSFTVREIDPQKPKSFYNDDHVEVIIKTARGTLSRETFLSSGSPEKPLNDLQLKNKFLDCMSHSEKTYTADDCRKIFEAVQNFDKITGIREFCQLM